ncbi:MAG: hydrogenase/urease maturation nickel metallochaperone HypA, partial [Pseudanabaena sp.]
MHEVSIIQSMLDLAFEQAESQGANQIHQLNLRVGAISGVVPCDSACSKARSSIDWMILTSCIGFEGNRQLGQ